MSTPPRRLRRILAVGAIGLVLVALLGVAVRVQAHESGPPIAALDQARASDATVPVAPNPLFPLLGLVGSAWIPISAARRRRHALAERSRGTATVGESRWRALLLGAPPLTTS